MSRGVEGQTAGSTDCQSGFFRMLVGSATSRNSAAETVRRNCEAGGCGNSKVPARSPRKVFCAYEGAMLTRGETSLVKLHAGNVCSWVQV